MDHDVSFGAYVVGEYRLQFPSEYPLLFAILGGTRGTVVGLQFLGENPLLHLVEVVGNKHPPLALISLLK